MAATWAAGPAALPVLAAPATIVVNTTSISFLHDGLCSLPEAIYASNGTPEVDCEPGTAGLDNIRFKIGSGATIEVTTALPSLTEPVDIYGGTGRVHLHGPGSGNGLDVKAAGSVIHNLTIDNFSIGIKVGASGVTISGSRIGPNLDVGIYSSEPGVTIGGSNPRTPDPCSGDCNLISGNADSGLYLAAGGTVTGNLIGTDAAGTSASPNGIGISVSSGTWTFGGVTADLRNVVSGNTSHGLDLNGCSCVVQGNYVGLNAAGTTAIANGGNGLDLQNTGGTIGGTLPGAGNVVSGNVGNGIEVGTAGPSSSLDVFGNRIGTKAAGGSLGNGGHGIQKAASSPLTRIGLPGTSGAANVIAFNAGDGVRVDGSKTSVRGNSIHDNGGKGIRVFQAVTIPTIVGNSPLHGTSCAGCVIDVYSDSADEGRTYEGSTTADGSGNWSYSGTLAGPNVTATSTAGGETSEFSAPTTSAKPGRPDGRIKKGSGSLVGNNIYNATGANQTITASGAKGSTITFGISIQNDGSKDSFKVLGSGAATLGYSVKYYRGTTDITAAVAAGSFTTPALGKGDAYLIKAKVTIGGAAGSGSSVSRLVSLTSVADSSRSDAVNLVVKRK